MAFEHTEVPPEPRLAAGSSARTAQEAPPANEGRERVLLSSDVSAILWCGGNALVKVGRAGKVMFRQPGVTVLAAEVVEGSVEGIGIVTPRQFPGRL
jgi:hypothetical protein